MTASPMLAASPVENAMEPSARPPPNRKIVPQSMRTASAQDIVKRRCCQLTGSMNRSIAPVIAAAASGIEDS